MSGVSCLVSHVLWLMSCVSCLVSFVWCHLCYTINIFFSFVYCPVSESLCLCPVYVMLIVFCICNPLISFFCLVSNVTCLMYFVFTTSCCPVSMLSFPLFIFLISYP